MTVPQPYLQTQLLYAPNVMSYQGQSVLGIQPISLGPSAQTGDVNVTISTQFNANYSGYQPHSIPSQSVVLKRANSQDKNRDEPEGKRRKATPTFKIIEKNQITVNPNDRNTSNILQNTSSTLQINKNGVYESHTFIPGLGLQLYKISSPILWLVASQNQQPTLMRLHDNESIRSSEESNLSLYAYIAK